jgi:hypothetical protein
MCVAAVLLGLSGAAVADPCEPLRQRIESQIAAKGVTEFSVTVVAIEAQVEGKVVGWCDTGQRKVIYRRGAPAEPGRVSVQLPAVQPRARPTPPTPPSPIITECRDGSVITSGDCPT